MQFLVMVLLLAIYLYRLVNRISLSEYQRACCF